MTSVIGVSFHRVGKLYWFDPNDIKTKDGMPVIVETARGTDYGIISGSPLQVLDEQVVQPLRKIVRIATEADLKITDANRRKEAEAFSIAQEKILKHGLEMKLVEVEYAFDNSRIVFYFTANGRVDFRELVRDLASVFRARIELRQIGVRDEAKMIGGLGPCGRPICCRQFLADFQPVSIKMAKEQNLSLNPTKISGLCSRLMCCLKYEQDYYEEMHRHMPRVGREVETPDGIGMVVDVNVLKERLTVKIQLKDNWEYQYYPFEALESHISKGKYTLKKIEAVPNAEEDEWLIADEPHENVRRKSTALVEISNGMPLDNGSMPEVVQNRVATPDVETVYHGERSQRRRNRRRGSKLDERRLQGKRDREVDE